MIYEHLWTPRSPTSNQVRKMMVGAPCSFWQTSCRPFFHVASQRFSVLVVHVVLRFAIRGEAQNDVGHWIHESSYELLEHDQIMVRKIIHSEYEIYEYLGLWAHASFQFHHFSRHNSASSLSWPCLVKPKIRLCSKIVSGQFLSHPRGPELPKSAGSQLELTVSLGATDSPVLIQAM